MWGLLLLLLGITVVSVQALVRFIGERHPRQVWVSGPARQAVDQVAGIAQGLIPSIIAPRPPINVIVFGSSRTGRGFDRFAYEAEIERRCGRPVRAWRFGFGFIGISPINQRLMARQMADVLRAWSVGWDLALVELAPFQATHRVSQGEYGAGQDEWRTFLSTEADLLAELPVSPPRSLRLMSYAFFYEGTNPHRLTRFFIQQVMGAPPPKARNPRVEALSRALRGVEPRWFRIRGWRVDARGAAWAMSASQLSPEGTRLLAEIKAELATEREAFMPRDRQWRIDCCDAEALRLDPAQLDAFRALLTEFDRMSKKTAVYLPPENRQWLRVTEDADARVDAFLKTLPTPVLDLSRDPEFSDADFYDTTHLDMLGAVKMSTRLAERTARWLCPSGPPQKGR